MQLPKTSIHARDLKFSDDLAGEKTTLGPVWAFDLEKSRNTPPPIPYRPRKTPTSCKLIGVIYSIAFPRKLGIRISFTETEKYIDVIIENNGILSEDTLLNLKEHIHRPPENAAFTGLVNTHHRLILFYGRDSGLRFERSEFGGMLVSLRILLNHSSDLEETRNDASDPDR